MYNLVQNKSFPISVVERTSYTPPKPDPADAMFARNAIRSNAIVRTAEESLPDGDPLKGYLRANSRSRLDELTRKMKRGDRLSRAEIEEYMSLMYRNGKIGREAIAPALGEGGF